MKLPRILGILILFFFCSSSVVGNETPLRFISLEWEPYAGKSLPGQGVLVDRVREILEQEGIALEVSFMPWRRARETARQDLYAGYFPAWHNEVDEGFFRSPPVGSSSIGLLSLRRDNGRGSLEAYFRSAKVGYIDTYDYPDNLKNLIHRFPEGAVPVRNERVLIRSLSAGLVDYALTDIQVGQFLGRLYHGDALYVVETVMTVDLFLALKRDEAYEEIVNRIVEILRAADLKSSD